MAHRLWEHLLDPIHIENKRLKKSYACEIKSTKKAHWEQFLQEMDEKSVLRAHCYVTGDPLDGGKAHIPTLRVKTPDGSFSSIEPNSDKSSV